uniref:SFRICE_038455 n=1 Tax=Spodoptera frugiperda TaxID=7108 RepID=A0A2H1VLZ4_SPOFR
MCRAPVCDVKECNMMHHKLLHKERNVNTAAPAPPAMTTHESVTSARETTSPHNRRAYLKIVPVTLSGPYASLHTYALLDDGSTVTLIDASAADILGADGPESSMCIQGLGTEIKHERSRTVSLHIQGKYHSAPQKIEAARTVTRLDVTAQTVHAEDLNNCKHLDDIRNSLVYDRARPMILIGQDNWHLLVATKTRTGARDQPVASYTKLGWVLHGCQYTGNKDTSAFCGYMTIKENQEPEEEQPCLRTRIPREDLEQKTLGTLKQKSRRLSSRNFNKRKQEAPTMPKSHLGTLERLDKNEHRAKKSRVIAAQNDKATRCSSLSVLSTCSASARTSHSRGKIKAVQETVVPERRNKPKKLCITYLYKGLRNSGNTTYPFSRIVNQVRPHVLNDYGPICVAVDRHKENNRALSTSVMCKTYRNS